MKCNFHILPCSSTSYTCEYFYFSKLQADAQISFSNDTFITAHQKSIKLTLLDQLSTYRITTDTLPYDQPLIPLVLFVGPPASGKKFLGRYLANKFPKYVSNVLTIRINCNF